MPRGSISNDPGGGNMSGDESDLEASKSLGDLALKQIVTLTGLNVGTKRLHSPQEKNVDRDEVLAQEWSEYNKMKGEFASMQKRMVEYQRMLEEKLHRVKEAENFFKDDGVGFQQAKGKKPKPETVRVNKTKKESDVKNQASSRQSPKKVENVKEVARKIKEWVTKEDGRVAPIFEDPPAAVPDK